jgi:penicillin V acylase-like amidase (Ntn superfamily)
MKALHHTVPMKALFITLLILTLSSDSVFACTTFCLRTKDRVLFGRNYDWDIGDGLIFVNKRGVSKGSTGGDFTNPAKWISRYGSVTFNQYGRENPTGGMNEAGLVVEELWLDETKYPLDKTLPAIDTQEWIQYELDTSSTVSEALENARKVRIESEVKVHFLISDKSGNAATIEFIDGALVAHTGKDLAVQTLTNDSYAKSLAYLKVTSPERATGPNSLERFYRAARRTEAFAREARNEQEAVNAAFDILRNVAQGSGTQWSIVYDQIKRKIYFRTQQRPQIRTIDTTQFDFACGSDVQMLDANSTDSGDVTSKFVSYTRRANRDLLERSFNGTDFLKNIPGSARDFFAAYPESFPCQALPPNRATTAGVARGN